MEEKISVTVGEVTKEYAKGVTYLEISRDFQKDYTYDIILACVNNKLQELNKKVGQ